MLPNILYLSGTQQQNKLECLLTTNSSDEQKSFIVLILGQLGGGSLLRALGFILETGVALFL